MEKNAGMVAVVHGIRDSGLTVTLLDGRNQYTLMPNDRVPQQHSAPFHNLPSVHCGSQYTANECSGSAVAKNRDNAIQATDGRYASTYKTMHCNMTPTSPPQHVTEFPPQKPEVIRGHGNFVVGGYGSGETARPTVRTQNFRGGMVWSDRGSVCASRGTVQSDAFANSLRKYPSVSAERSTEIVERLISFSQAKSSPRNHNTYPCSPTRIDCESSKQTFVIDRNPSRNSHMGRVMYHPDSAKKNRVTDNSSAREKSRKCLLESNDSWNRSLFCKNYDVNCIKETARRLRERLKNLDSHATNASNKSSSSKMKEQYDYDAHLRRIYEREQESNNSVNMEIQAAAQMESKEILTLPRIVPMQRTIATSLSQIPSKIEASIGNGLFTTLNSSARVMRACSCKSIQVKLPLEAHLKTSSSSFDLCKTQFMNIINKRSKSEQELRNIKKAVPYAILNIIQEINNSTDFKEIFMQLKRSIGQNNNVCQNCRHILENFDILRKSVSNNNYFCDEFQFNFENQQPDKDFEERSKTNCNNESEVLKKKKHNNFLQQLSSSLLSHVDNFDNNTLSATDIIKDSKPKKESISIKYDNNKAKLLKKVIGRKRWPENGKCYQNYKDHNEKCVDVIHVNNVFEMNAEEIRNLIELDILAFTEKYRINITTESLDDLIEELLNLFMLDLKSTSVPNKAHMTKKITTILLNRGVSTFQSIYLTNILIDHWEEEFLTSSNAILSPSNHKSKTLFVFPNITQNSALYSQPHNITNANDYSINEVSQRDIDANIQLYLSQISNEINKWLTNLHLPQILDKEKQQSIINYLANEIVDRQKYLELNPCSEIAGTTELEHLKYQIFKVIYRFGIIDMTLLDHATDLMMRIQSITVPVFSIQKRNFEAKRSINPDKESEQSYHKFKVIEPSNLGASSSRRFVNNGDKCCKKDSCKRNIIMDSRSRSSFSGNISLKDPGRSHPVTSTKRLSSPSKLPSTDADNSYIGAINSNVHVEYPSSTNKITNNTPYIRSGTLFSGAIKIRDDENDEYYDQKEKNKNVTYEFTNRPLQTNETGINEINREYIQYLKEWVQNIPLRTTSANEQMVAKTTRTSMYNDILEAVAKLRSDPEAFNNRFLFEDLLDDEIEKIMSNIPQTPELNSKKHILKVKLIEKITDNNEFMKSASGKSYKHQLVESLKRALPEPNPQENENTDILQIFEELQILNLVEDFIVCSHYQNTDQIKAEAYKKKLIKHAEDFVDELKANHNKALMNIDRDLYLKEILDALKNVPLPSDKTIQEEADEIILSIEIDKWLSELPLIQIDNFVEQLHRKRLKNNLVKQILQEEKGPYNTVSVIDDSLKHDISQFLGKMSLQQGQSVNINLMADELIKRLKSRPKSIGSNNKKVVFNDSDYDEFSRNMPLCSTYAGHPTQNIEIPKRSVLSTKTVPAVDSSQQSHNGHYHNISKPLFDDLRLDQNCCNTDLSLQETPNYERFNNARPRSSSIKDNLEHQWYTLQESGQENLKPNISHRTDQSNQSIQASNPSDQSYSRHLHDVAKPVFDDLKLGSKCCNNENLDNNNATDPMDSSHKGENEPNWYTLQESRPEYPQLKTQQYSNGNSGFVPYAINTPHDVMDQERHNEVNQYNMSKRYEEEFIIPQQYLEKADKSEPYQNQRNISKRMSDIQSRDAVKGTNRYMFSQRFSNPGDSPNRYDGARLSQPSVKLDQISIPHSSYQPLTPEEPHRRIHPRGFQNIIEEPNRPDPQFNQSDVFYKSTDKDGIRQTIKRNKNFNANLSDSGIPEQLSGYYQPSMLTPPGYVPVRTGAKKGSSEKEDSEEGSDEKHEFRCRCIEKMLKNQRKHRYCPLDQHDGYPICLTPTFFYPYFY